MKGPLFILSGPSGSGKSTVLARLLAVTPFPLRPAISATTRKKRQGEKDGVNYYFWTREHFEEVVKADGFLEYAEVYGNYYGTLWSEVTPNQEKGTGVILEVDVQGAANVRRVCPDNVSIFLKAPSPEIYEERLRRRGTEDEATIQRRLAAARREEERIGEYTHVVISDGVDSAVAGLLAIIQRSFAAKE